VSGRKQLPRYEQDSFRGKRERQDAGEEPSKRLAAVKEKVVSINKPIC